MNGSITYLKWKLSNKQVYKIVFHILFFWLRSVSYCISTFFGFSLDLPQTKVIVERKVFYSFVLLNIFLLFLVLRSIVTGNIFSYYFSISIMIHNAIAALLVLNAVKLGLNMWFNATFTSISLFYFLEGLITMYISYLQKNEDNVRLFKTIGANPVINNAFATRKSLEALAEANIFFAWFIFRKLLNHSKIAKYISWCSLVFAILAILQQFAIFLDRYKENNLQRKLAIATSFFKIIVAIILLSLRLYCHFFMKDAAIEIFVTLISVDILIVSVIMHYFLIKDYLQFGSGLKEFFEFKTKRLQL